jgi:hypothetical protein
MNVLIISSESAAVAAACVSADRLDLATLGSFIERQSSMAYEVI